MIFSPVHPPKDPKECEPWLYEAIQRLNRAASNVTLGQAAISRNETPDGTGVPLIDTSLWFYKPGLSGGQIAHGDTNSGGILTLSSTAAASKGLIYLGTGRISAYDEANQRLGLGLVAPSARLHLLGATGGGETTYLPAGDVNDGGTGGSGLLAGVTTVGTVTGWSCYTGAGTPQPPPAYLAIRTNDDDTLYIGNETTGSGGANPQVCTFSTPISGSRIWTITYRCRWLSLPAAGSETIKFRIVLSNGRYYESALIPVNGPVTTSWATFTTTIDTSTAGTLAGTANSIEIFGPNTNRYFLVTYIALSYSAGSDIIRAASSDGTVGLRMDGNRFVGIGTSTDTLTRYLTIQSAGNVPLAILTSSPTLNMTEWLDGLTQRAAVTKDGYFSTRALILNGSTSGALTLQTPAVLTSYTLNMPDRQGAVESIPVNDGSGQLRFATAIVYDDELVFYEDDVVWS